MWKISAPYLWQTLRHRLGGLAVVVVGGFVAGSVATLKSLIESRIIQLVATAIDEHRPQDVWSDPLGDLGGVDGDWISSQMSRLLPDLTMSGAVGVYAGISVLAAVVAVLTTASREAISREMFNRLYTDGLQATFTQRPASKFGQSVGEVGGLAGSIQQGANSVAGAYAFAVEAGQYVFALGAVVFALSSVNMLFALCCLGLAGFFALVSCVQGFHLNTRRERFDERRRELFGFTDSVIRNRDVLLAHERKDLYIDRLGTATNELASIDQQLSVRERAYDGVINVMQDLGQIAILAIVLGAAARGAHVEQVGEAYFYVSIFARLMWPIRSLLGGYDEVRRSMSASKTLVSMLADRLPEVTSVRDAAPIPSTPYAARFDDVHFEYELGSAVVEACSFVIPRGGVTLIVGRSGSGKTTIARMLLGFLRAQHGTVEVLGRSQDEWNREELLGHMSYLAQTDHVIDGTVAENLFVNDPSDFQQMAKALRESGLIATETAAARMLSTSAKSLSEGQQQRLALARIFADEASIIVLDEPLAGVDAFTFSEIREHLATWLKNPNRTVVLISHRLAFASSATHVIMLGGDGRVVEEGDPLSLAAKSDGTFARLLKVARAELQPTDV